MKTRWLILIFTIICFSNGYAKHPIKNGQYDLSGFDFASGEKVKLDGEWEFYWNQLLTPEDFASATAPRNDGMFVYPSSWADIQLQGKNLPSDGYCTIRLRLQVKPTHRYIDVQMGQILTAYKLFINGKEVASNGQVGTTHDQYDARFIPENIPLLLDTSHYEFVLQIANFRHKFSGPVNSIELRDARSAHVSHLIRVGFDVFLFGAIFIMALYHFALYILRRKDASSLYFGIFCLLQAIRAICTGEEFLAFILPDLSWEFAYKFDYLTFYLGTPVFGAFLNALFPSTKPRWVLRGIYIVGALASLLVMFTPAIIYTQTVTFYQLFTVVGIVYFVVIVIKAILKKTEGAKTMMLGCFIFFASIIHDFLYNQHIINTMELVVFGLFLFIFMQSYLLARRFSNAFVRNEELTETLNYQNQNLEKLVKARTSEIEQQKEEISAQRDALEDQNSQIVLQNNALETHKQKIEFQNEQIRASIRYAQTIQRAILPIQQLLNDTFSNFVLYRPKDIVSGDFYWFANVRNQQHEYFFIAVVDCTGHGVPGAFMSMIGNRLLNMIIMEKDFMQTGEILNQLDLEVRKALNQDSGQNNDGMDVCLCRLEKTNEQSYELLFSGAKNDLWWISAQTKELQLIAADRRSIGGTSARKKGEPFGQQTITINKQDMLYLMTDGYIDQSGNERKRFGTSRMKELVNHVCSLPLAQQQQQLEESLDAYKNKEEQRDDITVLGIRI